MNIAEEYAWRWTELEKLQAHYTDFRDLYADVSEHLLGFEPTWMQYDIADYVANGAKWRMIQAQRGQAKTTIAGCYAIYRLIHDPTHRVLIISAGTTMAKEISTWCIQIINTMPELEVLRCDKSHPGARSSVEAYDVHHMLKGAGASPSIKCLGITSAMQGSRADLLIPDDIESSKNSLTQIMREQLKHLTRDFSSINSHGEILYLGTPQSVDSIYNDLPARDFDIRIWPGRYPSKKDQENVYGSALAPSLVAHLEADESLRTGHGLDGDLGVCTDPGMMNEETLCKKEADQGKAYFNLQFMLNTALMDSDRYPLKLRDLQFYNYDLEQSPGSLYWTNDREKKLDHHASSPIHKEGIYYSARAHPEYFNYSTRLMSIDPSGGGANGDETGIAIIFECNGYLSAQWVTGIPGGTNQENLKEIVELCQEYKVNNIIVEKNYGNGAYTEALRGAMLSAEFRCDIEEVWSTGQKELRIVDALDPVMGTHKLIIDKRVLEHDVISTQKYPVALRSSYQLLFQMCKITRDRGALLHDDRLEALSQGVSHLVSKISINAEREISKKKAQKLKDYQQDPFGIWRNSHSMAPRAAKGSGNPLNRFSQAKGIKPNSRS